jgi:hypothetical protein
MGKTAGHPTFPIATSGGNTGGMSTRGTVALLLSLTACAGNPWRGVDPDRMTITVTGTITAIELPATGDARLDLELRAGDRYALAPGQEQLGCIVHPREREIMERILRRLVIGQAVEVSGYWTARDEAEGTRYYINDTTSVDPFVR